jgi:hypothetical protein
MMSEIDTMCLARPTHRTRSAMGEAAIDAWLIQALATRYDPTLPDDLPPELAALLREHH